MDKIGVLVDALGTVQSSLLRVELCVRELTVVEKEHGEIFQPLFVSVDPARDTHAKIATYLHDFHQRLIGLVGDYASTKSICKAYRVYFSTPPGADPKGDYLVDHSIFVYLMDPRGEFVEAFGQSTKTEEIIERVKKELAVWEDKEGKKV